MHGLLRQIPALVECVTTRNTLKYPHLGLAYYKVHPRLFYGYEKISRGGSYMFVAFPGKAVLDGVFLKKLAETTLGTVLPSLDMEKLMELSEAFKALKSPRARKVVKWAEKHAHQRTALKASYTYNDLK